MKGIVYVIFCGDEVDSQIYYIGSTCQKLNLRFNSHKSKARKGYKRKLYDEMRNYGVDNFNIRQILETETTKEELKKKEGSFIEAYKFLYGDKLANRYIAGRDAKIAKKEYNKSHPEEISESHHKFYLKHKDDLFTCKCGKTVKALNKYRHEKSMSHQKFILSKTI